MRVEYLPVALMCVGCMVEVLGFFVRCDYAVDMGFYLAVIGFVGIHFMGGVPPKRERGGSES